MVFVQLVLDIWPRSLKVISSKGAHSKFTSVIFRANSDNNALEIKIILLRFGLGLNVLKEQYK